MFVEMIARKTCIILHWGRTCISNSLFEAKIASFLTSCAYITVQVLPSYPKLKQPDRLDLFNFILDPR